MFFHPRHQVRNELGRPWTTSTFSLAIFNDVTFAAFLTHYHDAMNEILDLQRDLCAKDFAFGEEYKSGTRPFLFSFPFLSERVALRSMLTGLEPHTFEPATFCVGVSAMGM